MSPDGRLLASSSGGGSLWVWDLAAGKDLSANDEAHRGSVHQVIAAGKLVATVGDDDTIRLWDTTGKQRLKLTHDGHGIHDAALSPDGTKLISSSYDNSVCLWDAATGKKIYKLPGHGNLGIRGIVQFTADGKHFFSWGNDLYLRKWDVVTGKALLEHAIRPKGMKLVDDEDGPNDREMMFLSFERPTFSPDGKLFLLCTGREFHVFDAASGVEQGQITIDGGHIVSTAISRDNRFLLASAWGKPVQTKLPDGRTRFSSAKEHTVRVWELATKQLRHEVVLTDGNVGPVAFSPDGAIFAAATGGAEPRIRLWNASTGKEVGSLQSFRGQVRSMAFSVDGTELITGMQNTTALIWNVSAAIK